MNARERLRRLAWQRRQEMQRQEEMHGTVTYRAATPSLSASLYRAPVDASELAHFPEDLVKNAVSRLGVPPFALSGHDVHISTTSWHTAAAKWARAGFEVFLDVHEGRVVRMYVYLPGPLGGELIFSHYLDATEQLLADAIMRYM